MKIGRNDPCPCGSGKKYKKCCLPKDQQILRDQPTIAEAPVPFATSDGEDRQDEETWAYVDGPELPPLHEFPSPEENLPDLLPEQQQIIDAWWEETTPAYHKNDADQLIQRVEMALMEFPDLFVYLGLQDELLFELEAELARSGRTPEYITLLKRLRREQQQMYSHSYGAYDSSVIAELVVTGQVEQIPDYLDLFKQYPDSHPDYCQGICNLLAWRGLAEPLYLLCEAVATPLLTSSKVIGGDFALGWLLQREEIRFYEEGDESPEALKKAADAINQLGERIQHPLEANTKWLRAGLKGFLAPFPSDLRGTLSDQVQRQIGLSFVAHLRRTRRVPWVQAFYLADLLQDYLSWCKQAKKPWLRLQKQDIEAFVVDRSNQFFWVSGVTALAILQGMVWFAEYLGTATAISVPEAERIKQDCRQLFEAGRKAAESTDPAYRVCPTFEQLVAISED